MSTKVDDLMKQLLEIQGNSGSQSKKDGLYNQVQMQQIGNVFYNMMNLIGSQNKDERVVNLSNELRTMI